MSNVIKIYANMDWFRVAEQPEDSGLLPDIFTEMAQLWESDSEQNVEKIIKELSPFVGGRFVADNLDGWEEFFNEESYGEFEAAKINVVGIDFSEKPIPMCKVEAWFDVPLKEGILKNDVIKWNEENLDNHLTDAVIFFWDLDEIEELEELDLTVGDHNGCEAEIVN